MDVTLSVPTDFSYFETLHSHGWRHLPPFSPCDERNTLSRIERLRSGRVVKIDIAAQAAKLSMSVDRETDSAEIEAIVRRVLQLDRSLTEFHAYCASTPHLAHIPQKRQGRFLCSPTLFEDCLKVILTMNTTWAQTKAMVGRVVDGFGSPWPADPSLHAFPTPEQIASVGFDAFAATAKLGYRAKAVHSLAVDVASGALDLEALRDSSIPSEEILKRLLKLHGIGPYGAACLLLYLGRGDRVNVDSWARTLVTGELGRPVTDREVAAFFAEHGKWQGFVYSFYPWKNRGTAATADVAA